MASPFRLATHAALAQTKAMRIVTLCAALKTETDPEELVYIASQLAIALGDLSHQLRDCSEHIGAALERAEAA